MFENLFSGADAAGGGGWDWSFLDNIFGNSSYTQPNAKNWWDEIGATSPMADSSSGKSWDWGSAMDNADLAAADATTANLFGGGTNPDYMTGGGNWMETLRGVPSSAGSLIKEYPKTSLIGGGAALQGISTLLDTRRKNKQADALAGGAKNYMNALQGGRTEATNQYLQNMAGQKGNLVNKLSGIRADAGGANPRKMMEKLQRTQNEGFGDFQLNLAQQKTPELAAFTQATGGGKQSPWEAMLQGAAGGAAGTMGTAASTQLVRALMNNLLYA